MNPTAKAVITGLRVAWIALAVLSALLVAGGWPRPASCDASTYCADETTGSWVVVSSGIAVGIVALGAFVVWAVVVGTRLAHRAEREECEERASDVVAAP